MTTISQSEIPRLPILYHAKRLVPSGGTPYFPPSSHLNAKVGLIRTDITKLSLPDGAIVNAANSSLLNGGGVCGAIHHAAGRDLLDECLTLDGCETGEAKMTSAYELPCKNVIHAVGPVYWKAQKTNEHAKLLAGCYASALGLAVENGLDAVAFPAISTGIYGYPSYEAAEVAISAVRAFLETEEGARLELIVFCNFETQDEIAYIELLPNYFPPADDKEEPVRSPERKASEEVKTTSTATATHPRASSSSKNTPQEPLKKEEKSTRDLQPATASSEEEDEFVIVSGNVFAN